MERLHIDTEAAKNGPVREKVIEVGNKLQTASDRGFRTNNFDEYIELTTEGFEYRLPVVGSIKGREALGAYYQMAATNGTELRFGQPIRVTADDSTVTFEFPSEGKIAGIRGHRNIVAFSFDIHGDRASGAREYWGEVDSDLVQQIVAKTR